MDDVIAFDSNFQSSDDYSLIPLLAMQLCREACPRNMPTLNSALCLMDKPFEELLMVDFLRRG